VFIEESKVQGKLFTTGTWYSTLYRKLQASWIKDHSS